MEVQGDEGRGRGAGERERRMLKQTLEGSRKQNAGDLEGVRAANG
jgi:hypothetical protein